MSDVGSETNAFNTQQEEANSTGTQGLTLTRPFYHCVSGPQMQYEPIHEQATQKEERCPCKEGAGGERLLHYPVVKSADAEQLYSK